MTFTLSWNIQFGFSFEPLGCFSPTLADLSSVKLRWQIFVVPLFYFLQPFNLISSSSFVLFLIIFQLYLISFFWGVFPLVSAFPEAILFYLQWNTSIFFLKRCITAICWNSTMIMSKTQRFNANAVAVITRMMMLMLKHIF